MVPQLKPKSEQLAELRETLNITHDQFRSLIRKLQVSRQNIVAAPQLAHWFKEAVPDDWKAADALLRQFFALHRSASQLFVEPNEIVAGVTNALKPNRSGWSESDYARWKANEDLFKEIFELPVIAASAKALQLSYEHPRLFQNARILTDLRPVFTPDASGIEGAVVSHTLLIRYNDMDGDNELSVAIDERDLDSLIQQCERAQQKTKTIETQFKINRPISLLILGRDNENR
ncbi:MAG TPA: hypothetical protein VIS99_04970 [Terrimicrobiaceae bacterium]